MKATIDPARCSGSGNCAYWAPGVFDVGDDGIAVVLTDPGEHLDRVRLAVQHCPTNAITLREG
ncbi:MAG TPA: ferredoxin [Acidimicrobiales bacterium]|nr:ferredoxin [Acidimicrobiales bacterium]